MSSIKIRNLSKKYRFDVLNNFSINITKGVTLLKGVNGSGKSTLIKCIVGLIKYKGDIVVDGVIGYIPENFILPEYIKVEPYLKNISNLSNSKYKSYLKKFNLENKQNEYIMNLSKGMKQKVIIIQALIHEPDIIICDEPINGLDIELQKEFINILTELKRKGKTILIATHYIDLYKDIVDREINL